MLRLEHSYDTALPISWVDYVIETTGINPVGHFVWYYPPDNSIFGCPLAITLKGWIINRLLEIKEG